MTGKKKALGRGLSALLDHQESDDITPESGKEPGAGTIATISLDQIEPNPFQPRDHFDRIELADLALSIQQQGIIQPITVRRMTNNRYQIISGERRFKATQVAGLTDIPAFIRTANDEQMIEMALVENIQREDLNPIEIAISFQRLLEECHISQEDLSQRVGKDRSTISNYIRLLKLPAEIQIAIREKQVTMGHARAIIPVEDQGEQLTILKKILTKRLSVRQVEELVRKLEAGKSGISPAPDRDLTQKAQEITTRLQQKIQSRVDLKISQKGAGSIIIRFASEQELQNIMSRLEF